MHHKSFKRLDQILALVLVGPDFDERTTKELYTAANRGRSLQLVKVVLGNGPTG